jgi:hypothetical protein
MSNIGTIVMGAADVRKAADFWCRALGYVPRGGEVEDDWTVLVPVDGPGPGLSLGLSETPVQKYPRVHLDLYAVDRAAEVERFRRKRGFAYAETAWRAAFLSLTA